MRSMSVKRSSARLHVNTTIWALVRACLCVYVCVCVCVCGLMNYLSRISISEHSAQ